MHRSLTTTTRFLPSRNTAPTLSDSLAIRYVAGPQQEIFWPKGALALTFHWLFSITLRRVHPRVLWREISHIASKVVRRASSVPRLVGGKVRLINQCMLNGRHLCVRAMLFALWSTACLWSSHAPENDNPTNICKTSWKGRFRKIQKTVVWEAKERVSGKKTVNCTTSYLGNESAGRKP